MWINEWTMLCVTHEKKLTQSRLLGAIMRHIPIRQRSNLMSAGLNGLYKKATNKKRLNQRQLLYWYHYEPRWRRRLVHSHKMPNALLWKQIVYTNANIVRRARIKSVPNIFGFFPYIQTKCILIFVYICVFHRKLPLFCYCVSFLSISQIIISNLCEKFLEWMV